MASILYGISNCDTVRRARAWLSEHGIAYAFHDYRRSGAPQAALGAWMDELGWEALLNRSGSTFRGLPEFERLDLDRTRATDLMTRHPAVIRRPMLDLGPRRLIGFKPDLYAEAFGTG